MVIGFYPKNVSKYLLVAIILIMAGAIGNIIDSVFYGILFNDSYGQVATLFSNEPYGNIISWTCRGYVLFSYLSF